MSGAPADREEAPTAGQLREGLGLAARALGRAEGRAADPRLRALLARLAAVAGDALRLADGLTDADVAELAAAVASAAAEFEAEMGAAAG